MERKPENFIFHRRATEGAEIWGVLHRPEEPVLGGFTAEPWRARRAGIESLITLEKMITLRVDVTGATHFGRMEYGGYGVEVGVGSVG